MGGTILLADDSLTIQKVVELTFADSDHTVVAVGSGRELFERLANVKPDVILCDVIMPDTTGYDVCQALKSDPARLHIPVVLLTGTFEPFDRDRAVASGCDAIVTKPFEARELIETVEQLITRSKALAAEAGAMELEGLGVPEGVPALDFTTTGFDKMVPPPPSTPAPPEEGIELTASLAQPAAAAPPSEAAAAPAAGEPVTSPFALEPGPTPAASPVGGAAWEEDVTGAPAEVPPAPTAVPEPPVAAVVPEPAVATEPASTAATPAPAAVPAAAFELSDEHIDRIARRVVELASAQLERIAWEVIPDMAEMIVRQRIRELEEAAEQEN